jgi:hypothetical protein
MELEFEYFKLSRKLAANIQEKILFLEWENGVQLSSKNKTKFLDRLLNGDFYPFLEGNLDKTDFLELKYFVESLRKVLSKQQTDSNNLPKSFPSIEMSIKDVFYSWFDDRHAEQGRRVYKLVEFYLEKFYENNSDLSLWDYILLFDLDNNIEKPLGSSEVQRATFRFFKKCVSFQNKLLAESDKKEVKNTSENGQNLPSDLAVVREVYRESFTFKEIEEIVHFEKRRIGKIDANLLAENILFRLKNLMNKE